VRHHVVFSRAGDVSTIETFPPSDGFRMFDYAKNTFAGEQLTVGQWLAISGAAFSTGLGSRTSLGLSLLTGLANVRLGYWWESNSRSGVRRSSVAARISRALRWLFPVQSYLLDEFTSRFHGSALPYWNLSDGGHFENMGAYELVRRRLPVMVVVDAEADPDYTFSGLANLIRKARLDFGAEITFLDEKGLEEVFGDQPHYFGTLSDLRRGRRVSETRPQKRWPWRAARVEVEGSDQKRFSAAHGALARVTYPGSGPSQRDSWLIYVKPTLVGEESADLLQYHADHPSFPQEPTADQFFDEAQWESYRKLGEHIASVLFDANEKEYHLHGERLLRLNHRGDP